LTKKQLEDLAKQIKQGQAKDTPAEKHVKAKATLKNAIKRWGEHRRPRKN
jgi:predicted SAM-dependent methyltransferase